MRSKLNQMEVAADGVPALYPGEQFLAAEDDGFRLCFQRQSANIWHCHDFHELVIVLKGSGVHHTGLADYPIGRGDVLVIKPGDGHCYREPDRLELANVLFEPGKLRFDRLDLEEMPGYLALFAAAPEVRSRSRGAGGKRYKHTLGAGELSEAAALLRQLAAEDGARNPGRRFVRGALFQQLLALLGRSGAAAGGARRSRRMTALGAMLRFMAEHYAREITLAELAARGRVSIAGANRLFRELLGETPMEHLIRLRLDHAAGLLATTDLPVAAVAERSGYRDSNFFALHFRRGFGRSPSAYRRDSVPPPK